MFKAHGFYQAHVFFRVLFYAFFPVWIDKKRYECYTVAKEEMVFFTVLQIDRKEEPYAKCF